MARNALDGGGGTGTKKKKGSSLASNPFKCTPAGSTIVGPYNQDSVAKGAAVGVNVTHTSKPKQISTYSGSSSKSGSAPAARTASGGGAAVTNTGPSEAEIAASKARTAANNSARAGANTDIERLNAQITAKEGQKATNQASLDALKTLTGGGLQGVRDTQLKAIDDSLNTKLAQITATFDTSVGDFRENLRDNEATEADASFANLSNRARERGDLMTQALSQGAGESDIAKSQLQALRNWAANQGDVARSFFDTRTSINSAITDLNNATRTSKINEETSANSSRGGIWDDYYGAQADAYTQMSNLDQQNYLLQGEISSAEEQKGQSTGLLAWLDSGKNAEDWVAPTKKTTAAAKPPSYTSPYAAKAAEAAGSTWTNPGVSKETKEFKGEAQSEGSLNSSLVTTGTGTPARKKPEGATLRKW